MKNISLSFLTLLLCFANLFSQNAKTDSLLLLLESASEDTNKVNLFNDIAKTYIYTNPDTAVYYAEESIILANKTGFNKGKAMALDITGIYYQNRGEFDKAEIYYSRSLKLREQIGDPELTAVSYNNFGVLNRRKGELESSKDFFLKSLLISEELNDTAALSRVYNNLGLVMENMGQYDESVRYHLLSLREREKLDDKKAVASSLNNIGMVYISLEDFDEAIIYLEKSLKIKENIGNDRLTASTVINIGIVKYYQEKYDEALEYNERGLKIYESLDDKRNIGAILSNMAYISNKTGDYHKALSFNLRSIKILEEIQSAKQLCNAYNSLAETYIKLNNYNQAFVYAVKAEKLATEHGILGELRSSLHTLYAIKYEQKDYKSACLYLEQFTEIKDSLLNESNSKKIIELETKYETEKKEKEIAQLQKESTNQELTIERRDKTLYIIVGIFLLLIISSIFILRQFRIKQKQRSVELEQRLLRSQMNPHFIFNAVSCIQEYIMDKKPVEAGSYLSNFAMLMRSILNNSATEFISLEDEIQTLEHYLQLQKMRFPDKLSYEIKVSEELDPTELAVPPMLSQPFIENAVKHGIEKKKDGTGKVVVEFSLKNGSLLLEIKDNGIGLIASKDQEGKKHRSMATEITLSRIANFKKAYKKKVQFEITDLYNEKEELEGTRVFFELPEKYLN